MKGEGMDKVREALPELPASQAFSLTRSIYTADDMHAYARAALASRDAEIAKLRQGVPVALPNCTVADVGFRWDGDKQEHIPQVLVSFTPVPANRPNDDKGWKDRDAFAGMLASPPPAQPTQAEPVAPMSQPNRLVAYSAAAKLRELGYEWNGDAWFAAQPAQAEFHNPWRTSLENCISGDNYLRASEYRDLIEELDELYRLRAAQPPREPAQPLSDTVSVCKTDANNYCRILTALGMEEEGDPVAEVERLITERMSAGETK